jgi:hypothetical protein
MTLRALMETVEMLHSFTRDTLNAIKNEDQQQLQQQQQLSGPDSRNDSEELLNILDATHQQFRFSTGISTSTL